MVLVLSMSLLTFLLIHIDADLGADKNSQDLKPQEARILHINLNNAEKDQTIDIPVDQALFKLGFHFGTDKTPKTIDVGFKPELDDFYHRVGFATKSQNVIVVYPIFTQAAYGARGFYDYYHNKCDKRCLMVSIPERVEPYYSASEGSTIVLSMLNYSFISDIDIDRDPGILKKFEKVILLHNEYVTQKEFDAITSHPDVIFLYPNALYTKIDADYDRGTITLVRGHGYPYQDVKNGFNWRFDNSRFEFDVKCSNWKFYEIENGTMLNCYPDYEMFIDSGLLNKIRTLVD